MKKQTAVDWLEQEFIKLESTIGVHGVMYELLDQAKEMEKEQMKDAWDDGLFGKTDNFQQYYNETFEKL
jgi:hypothetical protein